jgi:hypothetical protein
LSATASTRAPDAAAAAPPQPVKVDGGKPQEVILVVEDDALMRRIATESLNNWATRPSTPKARRMH